MIPFPWAYPPIDRFARLLLTSDPEAPKRSYMPYEALALPAPGHRWIGVVMGARENEPIAWEGYYRWSKIEQASAEAFRVRQQVLARAIREGSLS